MTKTAVATPGPGPEPVVTATVCSLCGLAWEKHGDKPTKDDCIRLLKAKLASGPTTTWLMNSSTANSSTAGTAYQPGTIIQDRIA